MHICRVRIEHFRNFRHLDIKLGEHAVIVGENKVGKSNFLRALRLVFDPSLPDSARQLRSEDFWDGIARPISKETRILVSVDLQGFDKNDDQLASLGTFLVEGTPMTARLTYEFRCGGRTPDDFEFVVYGGDREEARLSSSIRRRLAMDLIPALRDAESDLGSWRRSPLRPLLSKMADRIGLEEKETIGHEVERATQSILDLEQVKELGGLVSGTLKSLVGSAQAADIQLGLAPTDADRLLRSLRILIDGGLRGVGEASLGVANSLYLTLKLLETQQLASDGVRDHTFLAIEEPEAHLHPHVQRNIFGSILGKRTHLPQKVHEQLVSRTVLLTTHSPYIASVAPLRSLILLRRTRNGTEATSAAAVELSRADEEDLERYLDVTRAEMLFARAVLLVEGDAEIFISPRLAEFEGVDLDALGITVCSVAGTNFAPHVKLLKALKIPFAVVTDLDDRAEQEGGDDGPLGERRVVDLMRHIMTTSAYEAASFEEVLAEAEGHGVFLGGSTFELDLVRSGRVQSMTTVLKQLAPGPTASKRADAWLAARRVPKDQEQRFLKDIEAVGKGRYAQRLAATMKKAPGKNGPPYILKALSFLANKAQSQ